MTFNNEQCRLGTKKNGKEKKKAKHYYTKLNIQHKVSTHYFLIQPPIFGSVLHA